MVDRAEMQFNKCGPTEATTFACPHCGFGQKVQPFWTDLGSLETTVWQCLNCTEYTVDLSLYGDVQDTRRVFPANRGRAPIQYDHCDPEVLRTYKEACDLTSVSAGAAGAFARKTVELILEKRGYNQTWLAQKIDAAVAEIDFDKRLPKRILTRLDYLKEAGNFGIHIRRNSVTTEIVEVEDIEVEACLDTVEELIQECYEQPGEDQLRRDAMNVKLGAAGKKLI